MGYYICVPDQTTVDDPVKRPLQDTFFLFCLLEQIELGPFLWIFKSFYQDWARYMFLDLCIQKLCHHTQDQSEGTKIPIKSQQTYSFKVYVCDNPNEYIAAPFTYLAGQLSVCFWQGGSMGQVCL